MNGILDISSISSQCYGNVLQVEQEAKMLTSPQTTTETA